MLRVLTRRFWVPNPSRHNFSPCAPFEPQQKKFNRTCRFIVSQTEAVSLVNILSSFLFLDDFGANRQNKDSTGKSETSRSQCWIESKNSSGRFWRRILNSASNTGFWPLIGQPEKLCSANQSARYFQCAIIGYTCVDTWTHYITRGKTRKLHNFYSSILVHSKFIYLVRERPFPSIRIGSVSHPVLGHENLFPIRLIWHCVTIGENLLHSTPSTETFNLRDGAS